MGALFERQEGGHLLIEMFDPEFQVIGVGRVGRRHLLFRALDHV